MLLLAASLVGLMAPAEEAFAQANYPSRPVRVVLPYGPGGVADVTMRLIANRLSEKLNQQFVIENRPGAAGVVAAKSVSGSAPDGYTLFMTGNGSAISASLFKAPPYDIAKDFTPVAILAQFEMLLAVKADSPLNSVQKLVAYARANPGKLNFGTINRGSTQHLSAELFKLVADVDVTQVTFRTTPELVTALMRGDIDIGFDYFAAFQSAIVGKQIAIIATSGEQRSPQLPDVPTVKESAYPDYVVTSWNALHGPAGVPKDVVTILNREINAALTAPEVKERMNQLGIEGVNSTPEELTKRMTGDIEKWARVIDKAGIEKQ
jgi:tripartite-type tricarboxylate transporter receptor subunit TctC